MTLLAHETEFWLRLMWADLVMDDLLWLDHLSMTEAYSTAFFPPLTIPD